MKFIITKSTLCLAIIAISLSACRRDKTVEVTDQQVVDMLTASITDKGEDVQEETKSMHNNVVLAQYAQCDNEVAYSFDWSRTWGQRYYHRTVEGVRTTLCVNDELTGFLFQSNFTTGYEGPRWESNASGSKTGTLSGFNSQDSFYTWNDSSSKSGTGVIVQNGEQVETTFSFNSLIFIDKEDHVITGGSSDFTFTGVGENIEDINYSGTVDFLGNRQANIYLNGNTYSVSW